MKQPLQNNPVACSHGALDSQMELDTEMECRAADAVMSNDALLRLILERLEPPIARVQSLGVSRRWDAILLRELRFDGGREGSVMPEALAVLCRRAGPGLSKLHVASAACKGLKADHIVSALRGCCPGTSDGEATAAVGGGFSEVVELVTFMPSVSHRGPPWGFEAARALSRVCPRLARASCYLQTYEDDEHLLLDLFPAGSDATGGPSTYNFRTCMQFNAAAYRRIVMNPAVVALDSWETELRDEGAAVLGDALKANPSLAVLELVGNAIGPPGARALGAGLAAGCAPLQLLDLCASGTLAPSSAPNALCPVQVECSFPSLRSRRSVSYGSFCVRAQRLEHSGGRRRRSARRRDLRQPDTHEAPPLQQQDRFASPAPLNLESSAENTCSSFSETTIPVQQRKRINSRLRLPPCPAQMQPASNAGAAGARALAAALASNRGSAIATLNLGNNPMGEEGIASLAGALRANSSITDLSLWRTEMGDTGACALGAGAGGSRSLTKLTTTENPGVTEGGARSFALALVAAAAAYTTDDAAGQEMRGDGGGIGAGDASDGSTLAAARSAPVLERLCCFMDLLEDHDFADAATRAANNAVWEPAREVFREAGVAVEVVDGDFMYHFGY